ncbi:MAG: A/G-specific adenine glycosylase, partial [Pseudomonadota bacterium]
WYPHHKRDLPWRETRDPYAIWLSEVILQQTRVNQGLAYYERFLRRFPTVAALADAEEAAVLKAWEGLGYYSRARNLQAAARQIVQQGHFPPDVPGLLALRGVGPYTARAIACFAFDSQVGVLDGNVFRVLARLYADDTPIDTPAAKKHFQAQADDLARLSQDAYTHNQAMMELGATLCTPTRPACPYCPLRASCAAYSRGLQAQLPTRGKKQAKPRRPFTFYLHIQDQQLALVQKPEGFWQGLYTLPYQELAGPDAPLFSHIFTHFEMQLYLARQAPPPALHWQWVPLAALPAHPMPRAMHRLFQQLQLL